MAKKKVDKYQGADFVKPAEYDPKFKYFKKYERIEKKEPQELRFKNKIRNTRNLA